MLNYLSADWVFPVSSPPLKNGVVAIAGSGEINAVYSSDEAFTAGISAITRHQGALVPGFINCHCHLELSHLKGKIAQKTGLAGFISKILALRQQPEEEIMLAMQQADQEMYANGIVAVGDISNVIGSKNIKQKSKIYYHTFVEVFGFNRPSAPVIEAAVALKAAFFPLKASIVPHAPYSVSSSLFEAISSATTGTDILSIHNQETPGETEFFEHGTGSLAAFFAQAGIALNEAPCAEGNSLKYHLPQLPKNIATLLVHNTFSSKADVIFARQTHPNLYWCLCPQANLYIENALPDVEMLAKEELNITLGTDSLASNHQLNILAEMQTLQEQQHITFEQLLSWATLNGAKFLGIDAQYGSLEAGKRPGINLIKLGAAGEIESDKVEKII